MYTREGLVVLFKVVMIAVRLLSNISKHKDLNGLPLLVRACLLNNCTSASLSSKSVT